MKYQKFGILFALALGIAMPVLAKEGNEVETDVRGGANVELRGGLKDARDTLKAELDAKKDALKTTLDAQKTDFKQKLEAQKADLKLQKQRFEAELKAKIEASKTQLKAEIAKVKAERLSARKDFVNKHFGSAADAIANRQTKVAAMIAKLKAEGKDTAAAEASLKVSQDTLVSARAAITAFQSLDASTDANKDALKAAAKKAEDLLKQSRDALVKAITSLEAKVEVEVDDNGDATVTGTATVTQ